uniref:Reverse transcriptase domain-containing protein n=1 Tax=Tanacetum cinerariifolium TaxID=118510 RepID=A0A6L2NAJ7_TANCI|nr:hypothetical protein [Tanacetum cinerariifolium]
MRTRSSSNLPVESSPNPTTSNPKHRNRRRSNKPFILEESPVDTMADQRITAEFLRAPTEGYAKAIVHTIAVTTAMTSILKQLQATPPPASIKAVEEIYFTCGGAHPYYQCLAADGNTFLKLRDNIQGSESLPTNTIANPKGELKAITTRSGIVLDGPFVLIPTLFINPDEDERVEETLTDQDLAEYTIKMILRDDDERLTLNVRHDTSSYSNQPKKESINMINIFNDSSEDFLENLFATNHQSGNPNFSSHPNITSSEFKDDIFDPEGGNVLPEKLLDVDSTKYLHFPHNVNPLSGSTTSSSPNHLLEEFADELAPITFPPGNDNLPFDIENVKKLAISYASLILKYFDPPLHGLPFFKEVLGAETLLSFSSENEEKIFKPGILTSKGVHSSLIDEEEEDGGVNDNEDEAEVINAYEEFGQNFQVRESTSVGALLEGNSEIRSYSPIGCNLEGVRMVVIRLDKQMLDRGRIPAELQFERESPIYTASAPRVDDAYAMVRDADMAA